MSINSLFYFSSDFNSNVIHPSAASRHIADVLDLFTLWALKKKNDLNNSESLFTPELVHERFTSIIDIVAERNEIFPSTVRAPFTSKLDLDIETTIFLIHDFLIETVFRGTAQSDTDLWQLLDSVLDSDGMFLIDAVLYDALESDWKKHEKLLYELETHTLSVRAEQLADVTEIVMNTIAHRIINLNLLESEMSEESISRITTASIGKVAETRKINTSTIYSNIGRRNGFNYFTFVYLLTLSLKQVYFRDENIVNTPLWNKLKSIMSSDDMKYLKTRLGHIAEDTKIDIGLMKDYL